MKIEVRPHDPAWRVRYEREAESLRGALGSSFIRSHHIGSTAIPGIWAKPIIDILLEVVSVEALDGTAEPWLSLGYEPMGEYGIAGRRFFRKDGPDGTRTHHVHAFAEDDAEFARHLAFRDFLIAHPAIAREYSDLKRTLAAAHPDDRQAYVDGKDPFIRDIERQALNWRRHRPIGAIS